MDIFGEYTCYVLAVVAIIIAVLLIRFVASCLVRVVIIAVLLAVLIGGYLYFCDPELLQELQDTAEPLIEEAKEKVSDHK